MKTRIYEAPVVKELNQDIFVHIELGIHIIHISCTVNKNNNTWLGTGRARQL